MCRTLSEPGFTGLARFGTTIWAALVETRRATSPRRNLSPVLQGLGIAQSPAERHFNAADFCLRAKQIYNPNLLTRMYRLCMQCLPDKCLCNCVPLVPKDPKVPNRNILYLRRRHYEHSEAIQKKRRINTGLLRPQ